LLRVDLAALGAELESRREQEEDRRIVRTLVEVCNPAVIGKKLSELSFIAQSNCQVARILKGDRLCPLPSDLVLAEGQRLLLVARAYRLPPIIDLLGRRDDRPGLIMDVEGQSMHVVVSSHNIVGKSLSQLSLRSRFGVTVTRVIRHDLEFVPKPTDVIEYGDMLNAVGEREDLETFAAFAGHRDRSFNETDLISLGIGMVAGVVVGTARISLGESSFSLGMVGGPLFVALLLSHFGHVGPVRGHLPPAARMLMTEVGLVLFLASAGVTAGSALSDVLREHGLRLCLASTCVALAPMAAGALLAYFVFRMNLLQTLGVICGGMTSTPGLGALVAKTDSDAPIVSYTGAYPVALIMITIFAKMLVSALG
jgi:putative transport protein